MPNQDHRFFQGVSLEPLHTASLAEARSKLLSTLLLWLQLDQSYLKCSREIPELLSPTPPPLHSHQGESHCDVDQTSAGGSYSSLPQSCGSLSPSCSSTLPSYGGLLLSTALSQPCVKMSSPSYREPTAPTHLSIGPLYHLTATTKSFV